MFRLEVSTENAAFEGDNRAAEVAAILRKAADEIESGIDAANLRDLNGNTVGRFLFAAEREGLAARYHVFLKEERGQPDRWAIMRTDDGREVLAVTLSGYRVGAEPSTRDYADTVAKLLTGARVPFGGAQ